MFNFAANKNLNTMQVSMLANEIATDYWQFKFDEVVYVLRQGAKGRYHTFDRLDSGVIHGWFAEYQAERDEVLAMVTHNENVAHKKANEQDTMAAVAFVYGNSLPDVQDVTMEVKYAALALQSHSTEDLQKGLDYYTAHPHAPQAAVKREAAAMVLDQRRLAAAAEQARTEEARLKARGLLAAMDALETPTPDMELAAAKHFAEQRGIPKMPDAIKPAPMTIVRDSDTNAA